MADSTIANTYDEIKAALGKGPARFAPNDERSFEEQLNALSEDERKCYDKLIELWDAEIQKKTDNKDASKIPEKFSNEMILRFARCSPGPRKFKYQTAMKVMKNYDQRYLREVNASSLEEQLKTKTLFIVPGLQSADGHDVFYMRPSRYFPKVTSTKTIIDNLAYCMSVLVNSRERNCSEGIAFMANMDNWEFTNFSVSYCYNFMMMLQGRIPVRVRLFLIVNPPSWFDKIWKIMKPMLASDFRKKVHIIKESKLDDFLMEGYKHFVPDDMTCGLVPTDDMVDDFITYRKHVEKK